MGLSTSCARSGDRMVQADATPVSLPGAEGWGAGGTEGAGDFAPRIIQPAVSVVEGKCVGRSEEMKQERVDS